MNFSTMNSTGSAGLAGTQSRIPVPVRKTKRSGSFSATGRLSGPFLSSHVSNFQAGHFGTRIENLRVFGATADKNHDQGKGSSRIGGIPGSKSSPSGLNSVYEPTNVSNPSTVQTLKSSKSTRQTSNQSPRTSRPRSNSSISPAVPRVESRPKSSQAVLNPRKSLTNLRKAKLDSKTSAVAATFAQDLDFSQTPKIKIRRSPPLTPMTTTKGFPKPLKTKVKQALSSGRLNLDSFAASQGLPEESGIPNNLFDAFDPETSGIVFEEEDGVKWFECVEISRLSLGNNGLKQVPPKIKCLSALASLDLRGNSIASLPDEVSQLSSLSTINLSYNSLSSLPECILNLPSLTQLVLKGNDFTALTSLPQLPSSLVLLDLSDTKLSTLPEELFQSKLRTLVASGNQISTPMQGGYSNDTLKEIDLKCNRIQGELFKQETTFTSLQSLDLTQNALTGVNVIAPKLTTLLLSMNKLSSTKPPAGSTSSTPSSIDQTLQSTTHLSILDISSNSLATLPGPILSITSLQRLDISNNDIVWFSPDLARLQDLKFLSVYGNPTRNLPKTASSEEVLETLRRRLDVPAK